MITSFSISKWLLLVSSLYDVLLMPSADRDSRQNAAIFLPEKSQNAATLQARKQREGADRHRVATRCLSAPSLCFLAWGSAPAGRVSVKERRLRNSMQKHMHLLHH